MCIDCLKERMPDRGTTCLEGGAYMLNYSECSQCKNKGFLGEEERVRSVSGGEGEDVGGQENREDSGNEEDIDEEEVISFKHVCKECQHVVATHKYTFSLSRDYQEYSMQCNLCGRGSDTVSVLPDDPREKALF